VPSKRGPVVVVQKDADGAVQREVRDEFAQVGEFGFVRNNNVVEPVSVNVCDLEPLGVLDSRVDHERPPPGDEEPRRSSYPYFDLAARAARCDDNVQDAVVINVARVPVGPLRHSIALSEPDVAFAVVPVCGIFDHAQVRHRVCAVVWESKEEVFVAVTVGIKRPPDHSKAVGPGVVG